jgi:Kef-type K+ transport system membrane component KefB
MAVLFTGAFAAESVGLAAIIGAFLVGLAMNRLVPAQSPLMTRISFVGNALFIPFFLLSVGLLVDLRVLVSSFQVWGLALLLTGYVVLGKMAAAHAVRLVFKHVDRLRAGSRSDSRRLRPLRRWPSRCWVLRSDFSTAFSSTPSS